MTRRRTTGSAATATPYLGRLAARSAATGTVLCLGIDPDPAALPPRSPRRRRRRALRPAPRRRRRAPHAAAVAKPNLAFFEAFGSAELGAGTDPGRDPGGHPGRDRRESAGDIKSTAARQAVALYDVLGADAITVSPYLGEEAIAPLLERTDRLAYVLCRTSNPGAPELQSLVVGDGEGPAEPLYLRVARRVTSWGPGGTVGLVVGATAPAELAEIRQVAPGLPFLVPGVGAQGGEIGPVLAEGPARGMRPAAPRPVVGSSSTSPAGSRPRRPA